MKAETFVQLQSAGQIFGIYVQSGFLHAPLTQGVQAGGDQRMGQTLFTVGPPVADILSIAAPALIFQVFGAV